MAQILVTGGAGYIGSHACKELVTHGHTPVVLDNLSRGFPEAVCWGPLVEGSIHDFSLVCKALRQHKIEAVLHFAAYAYVGESISYPQMYFENNVKGSLLLFEAMKEVGVKNLVFSSSCATYGESDGTPITEEHPQKPTNPYGLSKLMVEKMLQGYAEAGDLNFIALRYFNAAGADPGGKIGENHDPEPHLIPNLIKAALFGEKLNVFGNDYPTIDGTCVRDYIHVTDLASAHRLALDSLLNGDKKHLFYNLSNQSGYSIMELTQACESLTGKSISYEIKPRRPGDPAHLVGDSQKFVADFPWVRHHSSIKDILTTTMNWQKKLLRN